MVRSVSVQSGPSLDGCFVKLGRANKHRHEFAAALGPALEAVHEGVIAETAYDAHAGHFIVKVLHAPQIDPSLSAIAGDIVQNLRIALEYAGYQAVCKFRGRPWRGSFFPIVDKPSTFGEKRYARLLRRLGPDFAAIVKRHQPYREVNDYRSEGLATDIDEIVDLMNINRVLGWLRDLSNTDKHSLLIDPYARAADATFGPRLVEGCTPVEMLRIAEADLKPGAEVARFEANAINPFPKMEVDFRFRPRVGLAGLGDAENVLDALAAKVVRIISEFKPLI